MIAMFQEVATEYRALIQTRDASAALSLEGQQGESAHDENGAPSELLRALPMEIQHELSTCQERPFRVLVLQASSREQAEGARFVADSLQIDKEQTGQMAGLVLLPENFVREKLQSDISHLLADRQGNAPSEGHAPPRELAAYAEISGKFGVYIVCGSMYEPHKDNPRLYYITSVVMGPDGRSVGAYRKRRIHDAEVQAVGDRPFVFDVPQLGKVGLLICLDAEDRGLRDEVLNLGVRCVLNPVHIPALGGSRTQWQHALGSMADNFSHVCNARGITWIRCDLPFPDGMGSSQVIGPEYTQRVDSNKSQALPALVFPPPSSSAHVPLLMKVPAASRERGERTKMEQNCGARCTVSSVRLDGQVMAMKFFYPGDTPEVKITKIFASLVDGSVMVFQASPLVRGKIGSSCLICIEKMARAGTPMQQKIQAEVSAAQEAYSEAFSHESSLFSSSKATSVAPGPEGVPGEWLDESMTHFLGFNACGQLVLCKRGADGQLRRPLIIPAAEPVCQICVDRWSGSFATVSQTCSGISKVSLWSFAHNYIAAPLVEFLDV